MRSFGGKANRRAVLRTAAGAIAGSLATRSLAAAPQPPNILFIMADDLGYADLSCYGRPDFKTPHLDALAASGMRFLQAYANSPVCSATRTALITGRYQYRLRLGLEEPLLNSAVEIGLPPEHPTLPSLLKKAGYETTLIGKWHLGLLPKYGPLQSGYDHFFGFRGGVIDYYTHLASNRSDDLWDGDTPVKEVGYLTEMLGARAVDRVAAAAKAKKPFLLSLHFSAPHWPWEAPGDQAEAERLRTLSLFHFDGGTQDTYRRMVQAMDDQVGRILSALESAGARENTIVVFTSDNGGERFSSTWPFTGRKTELLEGGLRIPAIVSWPGHIKPGSVTDQTCMSMDWLPTLLAAAGAAPDPRSEPDGINLLPVLSGKTPPVERKLYWRYKSNAQRAMRDGAFKYLKILDNTFLFNVVQDPMERANLKTREPQIYTRLESQWRAWNKAMLPEIDETYVENFSGDQLADHIGSGKASPKAAVPD